MKRTTLKKRNDRTNYLPFMEVIRKAWQFTDRPQNRKMLREVNKEIHGKSLKKRHPRTRTNGAFGNLSKFNKRLKAQANN